MSDPQGGGAAEGEQGEPYRGNDEVAIGAYGLSETLGAPHGEVPLTSDGVPTWSRDDAETFDAYSDLRFFLNFVEPDQPDENDSGQLSRTIELFHAALPFSDGERRWLLDAHETAQTLKTELPQLMAGAETTITSNGLHQVVKGRDLIRRWAAWRRQVDEFAGQRTVEEAQGHARNIARLVLDEVRYERFFGHRESRQDKSAEPS